MMARSPQVAETLFLSDLPTPQQEQFRMRRLQVFNWGTFSGLHDIPIAERGFLFVGRSGSGKSTLLDAMAALLVPPLWVDFNAAARENERSGRDRSLASYVRGAWADRHDDDSGEVATQYLRRGATWSALVLEYRNALGRCISLARLLWLSGNSTGAADVRKHYIVAERPFDIATELEGFDLDLRKLKQRLVDVHHHDSFNAYAERFRRLLGIENETALRLLHKTQSAKNLGDLNHFLRDFMLERPETFEVADRLVAEFVELDAAHKAVVTAREQIETLRPARDGQERLQQVRRESGESQELLVGIDGFRDTRRLHLLDERIAAIDTADRGLAGAERAQDERTGHREAAIAELERQHREQGGDRIEDLQRERERCQRDRDDRLKRRGQAEQACRVLGWPLAGTAQGFAEQVDRARRHLDEGRERRARLDEDNVARRLEKTQLERDFAAARLEIESLQRNPSNIPAPMQALRARLCAALNLAENALPFIGELLQVRSEDAQWQGAIERVLHGFALSLLVDERHYPQVAAWVNETRLSGKLVYYRVGRVDAAQPRAIDPRSLVNRLERKQHAHHDWLRTELVRRFDYLCVESVQALRSAERAITREGQVKHGRERHEKDDRHAIDDRRHWVLGFDNRDKLKLYQSEAAELGARLAALNEQIRQLQQQRDQGNDHSHAAQVLATLDWSDIDAAPLLQRLDEIDAQLRQLREGNLTLRQLGERIDRERKQLAADTKALNDLRIERGGLAKERAVHEKEHQACAHRLEGVMLTPLQQRGLSERLEALPALSPSNLEAHFRAIERGIQEHIKALNDEAARLENAIVNRFAEFMRRWPEESGDFQADLASADDFLGRLQRLEQDGLPAHEARFFELLRTQSSQKLASLQTYMAQAHKEIRIRMEDVNASLERVPFNRGSLLQIRVEDRRLPEVIEFRQLLAGLLSHQQTEDRERAEQQFGALRGLVARLAAQDGEQRRWREQVLDVRLHVEFIGEELDVVDRRQLEVYRSGAGKSGGQRQKLATTCLAAALRYQLGGEDGGLPRYAAVVLDEAFDKADNEFTAMAMTIFENFGFQMIVATPLKSVMTLEPFIGGACFVEINGRHDSAVLLIEYDDEAQRLKLPDRARGAALADA